MNDKSSFAEIVTSLKQERDQLALRIHLASAQAQQEWSKLRDKCDALLADYEPARRAASETATNVSAALKLAAKEVQDGFAKIRKSL